MRACIHRGAREVGGSCVEVEHDGRSPFIDAGLPLDADLRDGVGDLPSKLRDGAAEVLALLISHGHPDHWGLAPAGSSSIPIYLGAATQRILAEAAFFSPAGVDLHAAGHLRDRTPLVLDPFTITPYLVDHSAFDAYALLVEAGGRRLLYSGDLRAHGRKAALFDTLVADPPPDVDVLLLEGTTLRRPAGDGYRSEAEVEQRCAELFDETDGLVLAAYSAQNIDRLVSIYRAARRSGRTLVIDLYTAEIVRATGRESIPQSTWDGVRVYVPQSQRVAVKRSGEFARVERLGQQRIFAEEIADRAGEFVMTFRGSMTGDIDRIGISPGSAVWSMWRGYLRSPSSAKLREWLEARDVPVHVVHASGHATPDDLRRFADAINARTVVPIHTAHPEDYTSLFDNVSMKGDGERWTV